MTGAVFTILFSLLRYKIVSKNQHCGLVCSFWSLDSQNTNDTGYQSFSEANCSILEMIPAWCINEPNDT